MRQSISEDADQITYLALDVLGKGKRERTADVLSKAVGGAEDRGLEVAGRKCREEGRHGLRADRLRAAHHKLQVAQVPLPPLLRRRFPGTPISGKGQYTRLVTVQDMWAED